MNLICTSYLLLHNESHMRPTIYLCELAIQKALFQDRFYLSGERLLSVHKAPSNKHCKQSSCGRQDSGAPKR